MRLGDDIKKHVGSGFINVAKLINKLIETKPEFNYTANVYKTLSSIGYIAVISSGIWSNVKTTNDNLLIVAIVCFHSNEKKKIYSFYLTGVGNRTFSSRQKIKICLTTRTSQVSQKRSRPRNYVYITSIILIQSDNENIKRNGNLRCVGFNHCGEWGIHDGEL